MNIKKYFKNHFKRTGFDSYISKNLHLHGSMCLDADFCTVLDGTFEGTSILEYGDTKNGSTTLHIGGDARAADNVEVQNVFITGSLTCKTLIVRGTLSIMDGAIVVCDLIKYNRLMIQNGARITGKLENIG